LYSGLHLNNIVAILTLSKGKKKKEKYDVTECHAIKELSTSKDPTMPQLQVI